MEIPDDIGYIVPWRARNALLSAEQLCRPCPGSASTQAEQCRRKSFGALTQEHMPDITCREYALNYIWQFMLHLNMLCVCL